MAVEVMTSLEVNCATRTVLNSLLCPLRGGPFDHTVFPFVPIESVFIYRHPDSMSSNLSDFLPSWRLRQAMGHLLDYYPHLTGRFQRNVTDRTFELAKFGSGAQLLLASSNTTLDAIASLNTNTGRLTVENLPGSGEQLTPPFNGTIEGVCRDPVLAIQHTRFQCGGVALGIRVHHMACDAYGFFQLVRDLAQIYRDLSGTDIDYLNLNASLLSSPPEIHSYLSDPHSISAEERKTALQYPQSLFYIERESNPSGNAKPAVDLRQRTEPPIIGRMLRFSGSDLMALKARASGPNPENWVSTFEALTAYLYQLVYKARIQYLVLRGASAESATSKIWTGLWASLNVRSKERLNLPPRYFPNAVHATCMQGSPQVLAHGNLCDVARSIHDMIRSEHKERILHTARWIAAQPDKSLLRVNFEFGNGNFTVSQWSGFDMYNGVSFDVDGSGKPVHPSLVAPPFTEISRVDGLAMILSSEETVERVASTKACPSSDLPSAIDVNLTLSEPLWEILDRSPDFRRLYR
ncbi:transferase [Aspergillus bertholletiae]|uniref:Transferase n=1 Tax=Aspergillus bertholletiae TaxID=1226010 RepID=A0A5N7AYP4_9EURO|nr:transferase [Aspergillus bertholletiae]